MILMLQRVLKRVGGGDFQAWSMGLKKSDVIQEMWIGRNASNVPEDPDASDHPLRPGQLRQRPDLFARMHRDPQRRPLWG